MAALSPMLSVLIVNFNSTPLLRNCLRALGRSTIADRIEVIVVDNASGDFDPDAIGGEFPWAALRPQRRNLTWTGGNNAAFETSQAPIILLLNPDTEVEPEALERALAHFGADPQLAGLGAFLIGPDGDIQRYYRRLPTITDVPTMLFEPWVRGTRRARRYLMTDEAFLGVTQVEQPPGAFLMFRRTLVGDQLLDPGYFNFLSDVELCARLNAGGPVKVFSDVRCYHRRAGAGIGTDDGVARLRLYHDFAYGLRRYFRTRSRMWQPWLLNGMLLAYWATRIIFIGRRGPRMLARAIATAAVAMAGRAPSY